MFLEIMHEMMSWCKGTMISDKLQSGRRPEGGKKPQSSCFKAAWLYKSDENHQFESQIVLTPRVPQHSWVEIWLREALHQLYKSVYAMLLVFSNLNVSCKLFWRWKFDQPNTQPDCSQWAHCHNTTCEIQREGLNERVQVYEWSESLCACPHFAI